MRLPLVAFILICVTSAVEDEVFKNNAALPDSADSQKRVKTWDRKSARPVDRIALDDLWKMASIPGLQVPVLHAPYPTFGMVMPLPFVWSSTPRFYPVNAVDLDFKVLGVTNYILTDAVDRYRQLIADRTGLSVYAPHWADQQEASLHALADRTNLPPVNDEAGTAGADPLSAEQTFTRWSHERSAWMHTWFDPHMAGNPGDPMLTKVLLHVKSHGDTWPSLRMDESYALLVEQRTVYLLANETWGALRALETLSQLLWRTRDKSRCFINQTYIFDRPRFPHRGLLVDTSRHFISKSTLLTNLDAMAHNKLNVFHWHIVDDNSYPYQSARHPDLSEKGAFNKRQVYTVDDIRQIVEFARMRGIRVIPEFDVPGHSRSLAYSKPELLSQCYNREQDMVHFGPLNVFQNATYTFLTELFQEAANLFPDEYMHLGGDEVDDICWTLDDQISALRSKLDLWSVTPNEYFWRRVQNIIATMGNQSARNHRKLILWEEVFTNVVDIQKSAIMQIWKPDSMPNIPDKGQVIYSACWYLDLLFDVRHWAPYYTCDPVERLGFGQLANTIVLGGEACMWAEYQSDDSILTKIWPVTSGIAERLWSPRWVNNLHSVGPRIEEHRCRMISRGFPQAVLLGPGSCEIPGAAASACSSPLAIAAEKPVIPLADSLPLRTPSPMSERLGPFFAGVLCGAAVVLGCCIYKNFLLVSRNTPFTLLWAPPRLWSARMFALTSAAILTTTCVLLFWLA